MQSNRSNDPGAVTVRVTPATTAGTTRPRTKRRGISPLFLVLITVIPILSLSCMLFGLGFYGRDWNTNFLGVSDMVAAEATPVSPLAHEIQITVDNAANGSAYQLDQQGFASITGKLQNNSAEILHSVQLRALLYRNTGESAEPVGGGIASVLEVPANSSVDFVIPAQVTGGPVPKNMSAAPAPNEGFTNVVVEVSSVWADVTPVSGGSH